ncbi:nicotinamide mononucleotide transporter [Periweissella fabaria]|uniref:Nicotinamide mononucleotide transporter n=1 Tax=Periweissella fabaria TaxID=546157 RepID=A0ABM8Z3E2_9LACO|nr:nicotinamide riboside transporter PnuC [Periweissella fabaria]MCM0596512.1 nicotinamide mononucleotide transporter [Periweissella fabaria]CAH0415759.1 hypothetical protein WFA24289_00056 [Periweissella fabaria]
MQTINKHGWWYNQLFTNWKRFEVIYISALILLQIIAYVIVPDSLIGMISGVAGVICLVYGMKGRKISFIFGFVQCVAMTYVAWISHAYGSFAIDIFYVISQPIGWYLWGNDAATHAFSKAKRQFVFGGAFIAWGVGWFILAMLHGQLPYLDSINFVVSFIAQILYILKFQENWSLWIVVNIANFIYWVILTVQTVTGHNDIGSLGANISQVTLQFALLFNAVYASRVWATGAADNEGGAGK